MHNNTFKKICINVYRELNNYNIKGNNKKQFISNTFDIHINTLYNWIHEADDNEELITSTNDISKYRNNKITISIESSIISFFNNKITCPNKIKKEIYNIFKVTLSYKDVLCVFKQNKLISDKQLIKNEIDKCIIDNIKANPILNAFNLIDIIQKKFNQSRSTTYIYKILKQNNISYKRVKIIKNPHLQEKQKNQLKKVSDEIKKVNINNIISLDEISITQFETAYYG